MSDEESLFAEMTDGVKPLKQDKVIIKPNEKADVSVSVRRHAALNDQRRDENFLSDADIPMVDPLDIIYKKMDGLQEGVYKKMRLGKYTLDAHLDLHRHTVEEARQALFRFIKTSLKLECRTILITHGKGERSNPPAKLKSYVNYWLHQIPEVMAFHSAQPKHGGTGSVYVLLKKSENKRHINRESFRR
ncbi:DNA endonuclease SmrA [Pleionea sp. CnH1-48]|uniref:DNA endonuclease SmrA n=1 Tax=Pleionea sp. CnH1-48 TaxID=2954494 RepID=UPI002096FB7B|nr:DNA endonuclease SmrA [Pleionea sp. CnH1-48]MCO7225316.1 DNA endonuclease SmrA [Pleionea sp. CnH1-48]